MSYANYGPDLRVQSIVNLSGADIVIAAAIGNVVTTTPLIQTAGLVEAPLVLGAGTWAITARVALNMFNGASLYDLIEADLFQNASQVAACPIACGASVVDGTNYELYGSVSYIVTLGAVTSFYWRLRTAGNVEIFRATAGYPHIVATKLSE